MTTITEPAPVTGTQPDSWDDVLLSGKINVRSWLENQTGVMADIHKLSRDFARGVNGSGTDEASLVVTQRSLSILEFQLLQHILADLKMVLGLDNAQLQQFKNRITPMVYDAIKWEFSRVVYNSLDTELAEQYKNPGLSQEHYYLGLVPKILEGELGYFDATDKSIALNLFLMGGDCVHTNDQGTSTVKIPHLDYSWSENLVKGAGNAFDMSQVTGESLLASLVTAMRYPAAAAVAPFLSIEAGVENGLARNPDDVERTLGQQQAGAGITQVGMMVVAARYAMPKEPSTSLAVRLQTNSSFGRQSTTALPRPTSRTGRQAGPNIPSTNYRTSGNLALAEAETLPWFRPYASLGSLPVEIEAANAPLVAPLVAKAGAGITAGGWGAGLAEWMPYMGGILFGIDTDGRDYDQILKELREDEERWKQIAQKRAEIEALRRINPDHAAIRELEMELSQIISGTMGNSQASGAPRASEGNGTTVSVVLTEDNKDLKRGDQVKFGQTGGKDLLWTVTFVERDANDNIEYLQITNARGKGTIPIFPNLFPSVTIVQDSPAPPARNVPMANRPPRASVTALPAAAIFGRGALEVHVWKNIGPDDTMMAIKFDNLAKAFDALIHDPKCYSATITDGKDSLGILSYDKNTGMFTFNNTTRETIYLEPHYDGIVIVPESALHASTILPGKSAQFPAAVNPPKNRLTDIRIIKYRPTP